MFNPRNLVQQKLESAKAKLENTAIEVSGTFSVLHQKNDTAFKQYTDIKIKLTNATKFVISSLKFSVVENFETDERVLDGYFDYTLTDNSTELQNKACSLEGFKTFFTKSINFVCDFNAFGKDVEIYSTTKELGLSDKIIINAGSDLDVPFNISYTAKNSDPFNNSPTMFESFISKNAALNSLAESLKDSFELSMKSIVIFSNTTDNSLNIFKSNILDLINLESIPFFSNQILDFDCDSAFGHHYNFYKTTSAEVDMLGDAEQLTDSAAA